MCACIHPMPLAARVHGGGLLTGLRAAEDDDARIGTLKCGGGVCGARQVLPLVSKKRPVTFDLC